MKIFQTISGKLLVGLGTIVVIIACGILPGPGAAPVITPTPTPTPVIGSGGAPQMVQNRCDGLSGTLEMQLLVGPSDAVGLEPLAIGNIPFTVTREGDTYTVSGSGPIDYKNVLEKEWGTYSVEFDMEASVTGTCQGDEQSGTLTMLVETSGEQKVEVRAEGYQGDFPWSGSQDFDLSYPIEEGATISGEGWAFVLHVNK